METEDIRKKEPSLWIPEDDKVFVAALGKLGEELNECGARIFRSIIQGIDAVDPDDHQTNRVLLLKELADVEALLEVAYDVMGHHSRDHSRVAAKMDMKRKWLRNLHRHITSGTQYVEKDASTAEEKG